MSLVFISYSHHDKDRLDELKANFDQAQIPYWFDRHIKAGDEWRDEIDDALRVASVVVVLVSPNSMASTYVTYEWGWAIGQGIPIIPLICKETSISQIHARLSKVQCENCIDGITDETIELIKNLLNTPLDIIYLQNLLINYLMPLKIYTRVINWLSPHVFAGLIPLETYNSLVLKARTEAYALVDKNLPEFMVGKSSAFTLYFLRECRTLLEKLNELRNSIALLAFLTTSLEQKEHQIRQVREIEIQAEASIEALFKKLGYLDAHLGALEHCLREELSTPLYKLQYEPMTITFLQAHLTEEAANLMWQTVQTVKQRLA